MSITNKYTIGHGVVKNKKVTAIIWQPFSSSSAMNNDCGDAIAVIARRRSYPSQLYKTRLQLVGLLVADKTYIFGIIVALTNCGMHLVTNKKMQLNYKLAITKNIRVVTRKKITNGNFTKQFTFENLKLNTRIKDIKILGKKTTNENFTSKLKIKIYIQNLYGFKQILICTNQVYSNVLKKRKQFHKIIASQYEKEFRVC